MNSTRKRRLIFFLAGFFVVGMARAEDVDLLLTNGNVYTVTEKQPKAEAVAVKANRIVFVGSNEDAKKFHAAKIVDLHGGTVVPGFTDSHCHIFGIGEREMRLNLEGINSLEDFLARVKERVDKTSPANGSLDAAGSKRSGNRRNFQRARTSTRSRQTILYFSHARMATPQLLIRRRLKLPESTGTRRIRSADKF